MYCSVWRRRGRASGCLAQTSALEVSDAPEGQAEVRRSAPGPLPDRSLREIADSTERSLRQPAKAKPYQAKQVRHVILKYKLGGER